MDDFNSIPASKNTSLHIPKPIYSQQKNAESRKRADERGIQHPNVPSHFTGRLARPTVKPFGDIHDPMIATFEDPMGFA